MADAPEDKTPQAGMMTMEQTAALLMLSKERILQLVRQNIIPKAARNSYPLVKTVQGYINFLRDENRKNTMTVAESGLKKRREAQIAQKMAMEAKELVPAEEAIAFAQYYTGTLLGMVVSLAPELTRNSDDRRKFDAAIDRIRVKMAGVLEKHAGDYEGLSGPDAPDEEVAA